MILPAALYPVFGLIYVLIQPQFLVQVLGYLVMEILIPVYWLSDRMVEAHHQQIFDSVFSHQLGSSHVITPIDATAHARLQQLVRERKGASHKSVPALTHVQEHLPPALQTLLWLFTPPDPKAPALQRLGKKLVNAPVKLIFPAGARLMTVRNMPAMASLALAPYLAKKGIHSPQEQEAVASAHKAQFWQFGVVAYALGLLPILSWLGTQLTVVGGALWAAELERTHFPLVP